MMILFFLILSIPDLADQHEKISNIGFAVFSVQDSAEYDFVSSPNEKTALKSIKFIQKNGEIVFDHEESFSGPDWLKNESRKIDYSLLHFKVTKIQSDYLEVVVNKETGERLWIKKSINIQYCSWNDYLLNMTTGIDRIDKTSSHIHITPNPKSKTISYDTKHDCLKVIEVKGDWIKVADNTYCDDNEKLEKAGWIQWRRNDILLIYYSLLC